MVTQNMCLPDASPAPDALLEKIARRSARVCVVGLGYVGLTVACALARAGFRVRGIDTDPAKVAHVMRGLYPLNGAEPELPALLAEQVNNSRLTVTGSYAACAQADVILVVVQTPVDPTTKTPSLEVVRGAVSSIGAHLRPQTLVVVESTIPPGTMRDQVVPLLEQASGLSAIDDFYVGCCPERVMPGKLLSNLTLCNRVMGGWTSPAGQVGAALYRTLTRGDVEVTDCLTAELVKTTENAYRDVQIAFANEVALVCEDRLIPAARAVNDSMPRHIGELLRRVLEEQRRELADSRVIVLGYAYLENSDDTRNSPTVDLVTWLQAGGARVAVHDPLVPGFRLDLAAASTGADALVVMVAHDCFRDLQLELLGRSMRTRILVDGRRLFAADAVTAAGFTYRCVGVGL